MSPAVRQEPDNTLNLLDVDFWLWYQEVTPKGMAHAFKIRFWEMFNAPGTYDILTDNQYKLPNSNDGCMWLRAPTACPEWNEGMEGDCRGSIKNKAIFFFNWPPYFSIFSHCLQFQKTQKQEKSRITT